MTKREILIDDKERIGRVSNRIQLSPVYNGVRYEDFCLVLKTLEDLLEMEINRSGRNV